MNFNFDTKKKYQILSGCAIGAGLLFYAFYNEIIIIRAPYKRSVYTTQDIERKKQKYFFYFWNDGSWQKEEKELISSPNKSHMLSYLVSTWLNMAREEKTQKKASLESVMLDANQQEAYISFDRNPFLKESSTHEKWMWIEGLLRTIRESGTNLQSVRFLIHHKLVPDYHLDFSRAWPINGFIA